MPMCKCKEMPRARSSSRASEASSRKIASAARTASLRRAPPVTLLFHAAFALELYEVGADAHRRGTVQRGVVGGVDPLDHGLHPLVAGRDRIQNLPLALEPVFQVIRQNRRRLF